MLQSPPPAVTLQLPSCHSHLMLRVGRHSLPEQGRFACGYAQVGVPAVAPTYCHCAPAEGRCMRMLFLSSVSSLSMPQTTGQVPPLHFQQLREQLCPARTPLPSLGSCLWEKQPVGRGDPGWGHRGNTHSRSLPRGHGLSTGQAPVIDPWLEACGGTWEQRDLIMPGVDTAL